jgi:membrane protease YdiL (CAAX protease family)
LTRPTEPPDPSDPSESAKRPDWRPAGLPGPSEAPDSAEWAVLDVPVDSPPPGAIATEEDLEDEEEVSTAEPSRVLAGPPGGRVFSLEGRPAPGLYLVAWLFSLAGFGILFMTLLASAEGVQAARGIQPLLGVVGTVLLGLGFAAGAGYQVVARSARPLEAYRGPSPALCFGVVLIVGTLLSLALGLLGLSAAADNAVAFLANLLAVAGAYALVVWLFVVRTGALNWREMGWPVGRPLDKIMSDVVVGMALTVPALFVILGLAVAVSTLLGGVQAPDIVPRSKAPLDVVLLGFATILVAPIGEELFFRGFALTAWWRDLGPRSAIIRSALFFGLVHIVNISSVDFATGIRQVILVLVQILFVRRGIAASIAAHAAYNAFIFFAVLAATNAPAPAP